MSLASPRDTELGSKLRQSEKEVRALREELDERGGLLEKTKAAIEELQLKLQEKQAEEEELRAEATRVIDEQAQTISTAEREIQGLESQVHELESQLREANLSIKHGSDAAQTASHEAKLEVEGLQSKVKELNMRTMTLQAEADARQEAIAGLERTAKEQRTALQSAQASLAAETAQRVRAEEASKRLLGEKQTLEAKLEAMRLDMTTTQQRNESVTQQRIAEITNLQAECASKQKEIISLMEQRTSTERECQAKLQAERLEHQEKLQVLEQKLAMISKGQSYNWEAHEHEWTRRLQEVEMHWEKRLRDGMIACERKFEEEAGDADQRVHAVEAQWEARLAEVEAQWAARLSDHQRAMEMHRAQVEGQQAALLAESTQAAMQAEVEQGLRAKLDEYELRMVEQAREAHAAVQAERAAADRLWAGRLEAAQARWAHDMAAAAEQVAEAKAQAQADAAHNTELVQQSAATRIAAAEAAHQRALEAAHGNWQQEREALQQAWQKRQKEAEQMYKSMEGQLQAKVAGITARLAAISHREGALDSSRREMTQQLEDLQSTYEAELQRRAESEAAARNAAQVCRSQLEGLRDQVEILQRQLREANQLPGSCGKHTSLVETALAAPSAASPTWPASPNQQFDAHPSGKGNKERVGFQYAIAPPSAAYHSTQPREARDTRQALDQDTGFARRGMRGDAGVPASAWRGGSSNHAPAPGDAEVIAALQELRTAGISPNRPSTAAPPSAWGSQAAARAGGAVPLAGSPGGYSSRVDTSPNHYSTAAATQGGASSPLVPLSPLPPNPPPVNNNSTNASNLSLADLAQPRSMAAYAQHNPAAQQPFLSELPLGQQPQAPPRTCNSPPFAPGSSRHEGHKLPPQSHHSSSDIEAIQQQLAAMRSTVAAASARNAKQAAMPFPANPPATQTAAGMQRADSIDRAASELAAHSTKEAIRPPVLDRSESLLSPAAAKHLMRYREQMGRMEPALPPAPYGGATKTAAPYATDASAPYGAAGAGHGTASSLAGFESILTAGGGQTRGGGPAGWGGFGLNGGAGGEAGALSGMAELPGAGMSTHSMSSLGGSSIGASSSVGPVLSQRPGTNRTRSVVRSLEPTLSGAASQSGHRL